MEFVPMQWLRNVPECGHARLSLPWTQVFDPRDGLTFTTLPALDGTPKGGKKLRKGKAVAPGVTTLAISNPELVARRSLVEPVFAAAQADVNLIPLALEDDAGPLEGDFVLIDPRQRIPMDRDASEAEWDHPENPHGSVVMVVKRLGWGRGRIPRTPVFRLAEHPDIIVMREDVAAGLEQATKGAIARVPAPYPYSMQFGSQVFNKAPQLNLVQVSFVPYPRVLPSPPWCAPDAGAKAAAAFWRLYAGEGKPGDREAALASPHYNHFLATLVDRDANDDTAAAALAHPHAAFRYASEVDRQPRDDTRLAAAKHPLAALAYAKYVDRGPHPVTQPATNVPAIAGAYEEVLKRSAQVVAWLQGKPAAPEAPKPPPGPRTWPAHQVPRYAEDGSADGPAPAHAPLEAALRSDIDAFIERGLALVEQPADAPPEAVVAAIHRAVDAHQQKARKFTKKQQAVMALGCAFGEQLHRALGYRWAQVRNADGSGGIALIAPDASVALYPLFLLERLLAPKASSNATLLTFNLVADGKLPPAAKPGAYLALT